MDKGMMCRGIPEPEEPLTQEKLNDFLNGLYNRAIMPSKIIYAFSKSFWQAERETLKWFNFTDEQLDKAEKHPDGFIEELSGTRCYISQKLT